MVICKNCGRAADKGETFCSNCNAFLEWFGESPTKPDVPPTPEAPPAVAPTVVPDRKVEARRPRAARPIDMTMGAKAVHVEPGGQASVTVEVHNRGTTVDQFTIEVLGPVAAWATVDPPRCNLMPGMSATATLLFRPPRSSAIPAGPIPADVGIRSHEHPETWAVDRVEVDVGPFVELDTRLAPSALQGVAGARTSIRAANSGNAPVELSLTAEDAEAALEFRITPPALRVTPGSTVDVAVDVRPRADLPPAPGRTRPFRITVTLRDGSRRVLDGTFTQAATPVDAGPPILATLTRNAARVEPGAQAEVRVEIVNQGPTVDRIAIELHGPAAAWATVDPARLTVLPERSATASILFGPPRTPGMYPGPYQADVAILSQEHPEVRVFDRIVVEVLPFAEVETRLTPSVLNGGREAIATVGVANRGNTRVEVALGGDDPAVALEFRIAPSTLRLEPGQAGTAKVHVRSRKGIPSGTELTRPFRALVRGSDGTRQAIDGTFIQAGPKPRQLGCLPCLFKWLLLLLALGAAAWFALDAIGFWRVGFDNVIRTLNLPVEEPAGGGPAGKDPAADLALRVEVSPPDAPVRTPFEVRVWATNNGPAASGAFGYQVAINQPGGTPLMREGEYMNAIPPGATALVTAWTDVTVTSRGPFEVVVSTSWLAFDDPNRDNNGASDMFHAP